MNIFPHENRYGNRPETTLKLFQYFISVSFHMYAHLKLKQNNFNENRRRRSAEM